jgi:hypothetical protein
MSSDTHCPHAVENGKTCQECAEEKKMFDDLLPPPVLPEKILERIRATDQLRKTSII